MCTCPASYLALRLLIPSRPLRSGVSHPSGGCGLDKLAGGSLESFELNLGTEQLLSLFSDKKVPETNIQPVGQSEMNSYSKALQSAYAVSHHISMKKQED
eukprot:CAMPEP_0184326166 /NCGR_PEP_ID=MMETSP1049-20130417/142419_1 /TAXON_ID=77928 /ORGANISM="Proteomonas sulcata, Strain CCMP704" /LENGTH=99 /DNA_ID=CAMNT_0026648343 /DNA_START=245 /DNA_END=545 /DNA_ORIENTATION=-